MPKIIMLKGLPGSGKTTWAKEWVKNNPGWIRVNKDSLRDMMGNYRPGKDEGLILEWRDIIIRSSLLLGRSIVVDDINFHAKHETCLREIAKNMCLHTPIGLETKIFDTPLEECIVRDAARANPVGAKVIKKIWREYVYKKPIPPEYIPGLPSAIICDLDGTLALHNGRSPYDVERCGTDLVNPPVEDVLYWNEGRDKIIFVTGREEKYREETAQWLNQKTDILHVGLFMRPTGDMREDSIVKEEIYNREIKGKYNVRFVLDDRNRVVNMWRRIGLTCFQVAEGDF